MVLERLKEVENFDSTEPLRLPGGYPESVMSSYVTASGTTWVTASCDTWVSAVEYLSTQEEKQPVGNRIRKSKDYEIRIYGRYVPEFF